MRPGSASEQQAGVAVVLDNVPECKVVRDVVDMGHIPRGDFDVSTPAGLDAYHTISSRFARQALETERHPTADRPYFTTIEIFRANAQFKVLNHDVEFVRKAAQQVLNEKRLGERLFNRVTRRTSAAKRIVSVLGNIQKATFTPPEPRPWD